MGRCKYENLLGIEPALHAVRKLNDIKEPKPGIFYLKNQGFMHFHEKDGKVWADARDGKNWGLPIEIPTKVTKTFIAKFVREISDRYSSSGGNY